MRKLVTICFVFISVASFSQLNRSNFTGNLESTFQYLNKDSLIGATQPASKGLLNSYMNVYYTHGNFKGGLRFESYLPRIQGYPTEFQGTGLGMRYIGYANNFIDATVGNFYEQFGAGLALRAYEDKALGYDNMLDGVRLKITPYKGITLKGVYGLQRLAFRSGISHGAGTVRGGDAEFSLSQIFPKIAEKEIDLMIGGSFVSKFQEDDNDLLILPQNVATYGGRMGIQYKGFTLDGEYVVKGQDPSQDNGYIYNPGFATVINAGYSRKGFGVTLSAKSVDNMSFRSERDKVLQVGLINYLPALNKTHTYNLVASLYPYATQPTGEVAFQGDIVYTIPKGTKIGGKYGTTLSLNASTAFRPKRTPNLNYPDDSTGVAYKTSPFRMSDSLYWLDINASIYRKFTKNFSATLSYFHLVLNNNIAAVTKQPGNITSNTFVFEFLYKFKKQSSLRAEFQVLLVNRIDSLNNKVRFNAKGSKPTDHGDWATVMLEYAINSHWMINVMDQYNFGNPVKSQRAHHPYVTVAYVTGPTRVSLGYGRQRAGMFCVGGVCRYVPASNGLTLSVTHSF
ncbi:MAG: DUF6029 family protein [Crocinitomicaceae bacterium]|nr:DUF6029 family protein [Crocinitomicaceae bacterium]